MNQASDTHELIASYALGVLDDEERASFERHLAGCATCREELPSLADAASALAWATEPASPSPELRGRILAGARKGGEVLPLVRRTRGRVLSGLAAAAACAAVGFAIWALSLHGSLGRERSARAAQAAALAILADPLARRVPLAGRTGVLAVRADGSAALAITRLGAAPSGRTYEAWVVRGRVPRRAGLFLGGASGATLVALDRPVRPGVSVAVTVERSQGVDRPTGRPILTANA
jgi:anti-sigma-K factor RskA